MKDSEKIELKKNIEEMEEKLNEMKQQLDKKENVWRWEPEKGEYYFFFTTVEDNGVQSYRWSGDNWDNNNYNNFNCFETEQEASDAFERHTIRAELEQLAKVSWGDIKISYKLSQEKYEIVYLYALCEGFHIEWRGSRGGVGGIYFSSEESAKKAIETIGQDRLKKLLFQN